VARQERHARVLSPDATAPAERATPERRHASASEGQRFVGFSAVEPSLRQTARQQQRYVSAAGAAAHARKPQTSHASARSSV